MPEPNQRAELDQAGGFRRCRRVGTEPQVARRPPHETHVPERLRRGGEEQSLCTGRELSDLPEEAPLDPVRERAGIRKGESSGQFTGGQTARQLEQRERVAPRLRDDPVSYPFVEPLGKACAQDGASIIRSEAGDR